MSTPRLLNLYKAMLETAWATSDESGLVSQIEIEEKDEVGTKKLSPFILEGKRLVMPTQEQLKNSGLSNVMVFHPLNENPTKGEAPVLARLRRAMAVRINWTIFRLILDMLRLATSYKEHEKLNPEQSEVLSILKNARTETMVAFVTMAQNALIESYTDAFVKFYLRRGGNIRGKTYSRSCMVSFPFYNELKKGEKNCYKVDLPQNDRDVLIALMEFIFPNIKDEEGYSRGSDSDVAPFTQAMYFGAGSVIGDLNDCVERYRPFIRMADLVLIGANWGDEMNDLGSFIRDIRGVPQQLGSDGSSRTSDEIANRTAISAAPPIAPQQQPQPVQQVVPAMPLNPTVQLGDPKVAQQFNNMQQQTQQQPAQKSRGVSLDELLRRGSAPQQVVVQQPVMMQPQVQNVWGGTTFTPMGAQQQQFQQQQFQQPQMQQQQPVNLAYTGFRNAAGGSL